jgi:hypothetical protein
VCTTLYDVMSQKITLLIFSLRFERHSLVRNTVSY